MAVRVVEAERDGEAGFAGRLGFRRTRSGRRLWSDADKGRIVRESFAAGAVVNDVARPPWHCPAAADALAQTGA